MKELLESLNLPGLIIRSIKKKKVFEKCLQVFEQVDIKIPDLEKDDEYDLLKVFADGNNLNWILIEVKNTNEYPWEHNKEASQHVKHSLFETTTRNGKKKSGSWD